jgi:hypothetical protein
MVDRTDIDALLIGALYGELTPADEARLTAHLESHPADRTALEDLTRTRAAVRDSRILAVQHEPSHAISALLLQEASRRAPRAPAGEAGASWFHRFVRSFAAHPAMAAAATIVLVVAAVGTFYLRGEDQFAKSEAPVMAPARSPETVGATAATAPTGGAGPASVAPEPAAPAAATSPADGLAAGSGAGPGGLDPAAAQGAAGGAAADQAPSSGRAMYETAKAEGKRGARDAELRKLDSSEEQAVNADKSPGKFQAPRGIEVQTRQLMPKDINDSKDSDDEKVAGPRERATRGGATKQVARNAPGAGAPATPPVPAAASPAFDPSPEQGTNRTNNDARRPAAKPAPSAQPPAPVSNLAPNAPSDRRLSKTANPSNSLSSASASNGDAARQAPADRTLLEWARKQHDQVIALVGANRCREAASAAIEIYSRAPDYFNANIANDRQIKPCLAYVNDQRDRADRTRAAKNANATTNDAPVQLAPSRK